METTGVRWGWLVAAAIVAFAVAVFAGVLVFARPYLPASLALPTFANGGQVTAEGKSEPPAPLPATARYETVADVKGMAGLTAPEGATIAPMAGAAGDIAVVRLSGMKSNSPAFGKPGVYLTLPPAFEQAASGQTVRVTVMARRASDAPGKSFAVAYSTNEVGNSGWQRFDLGDQLASYSFIYKVPVMKAGYGDFIGILPEEGGAVEISGIGAEVFPAGTELPPSASLTGSTTGTATTAAP